MRQMFQLLCVTSGHETSRSLAASGSTANPSPKTGCNFVKFLKKLPQGTPATAKPAAAAKSFQIAEETSSPATSQAKGKAKMAEPDSESEASSENEGKGSPETHTVDVTLPPAKRGRPRKQDLMAAVKKMNRG
ncbi:hypothetical protein PCASD_10843 [Puccinia coronata f. sp. avenae]|uniref:Uncharacterized protein n=1 Tax=Puccinia coronata f. sp. avenae TaxID=200324 RepID=A0A2N5UUI9_9BASI|nr:hypothetical protein PCASD_10843 [Puccinia coronata f. sp. avenae]